ncbi:LMBR1-like membrane protein domain-containing protein [Phthorimaea operculella]|nr:LMBR1-like membrane protein domain-containing protein [Phthorimaea operculella]
MSSEVLMAKDPGCFTFDSEYSDHQEVESQRKTSSFQRNVVYPLAMLLLLALTAITVLMVVQNTLELLIGIKALPLSTRQFTLGIASLSKLGWAGATLEAFLILYLHCASLTGLSAPMRAARLLPRAGRTPLARIIALCALLLMHSTAQPLLVKILGSSLCARCCSCTLPRSRCSSRYLVSSSSIYRAARLLPRAGRTPLARIIALCALLLMHSTAQPLLVKILGITNFDLLGEFGRIEWLGNLKLVLLYNAIFAATVTLCLASKFTASVRRELYNRFKWLTDWFTGHEDPITLAARESRASVSIERTISLETVQEKPSEAEQTEHLKTE